MPPRLIQGNPDDVARHNVRSHYNQRLVLTASVCRELQRTPDDLVGGRPQAAIEILAWWMRDVYDLPAGKDIKYTHGLDDPGLTQYASDMKIELVLGAAVCDALAMAYTADKDWELQSDKKRLRERLDEYLAAFGQ